MASDDLHDEYYVRIFRKGEPSSSDYHSFLHYLYFQFVDPKLHTDAAHNAVIRWETIRPKLYERIREICDDARRIRAGQDVPRFLSTSLDDAWPGLREAFQVLDQLVIETGIADLIEENFDVIMDELTLAELPPEDLEALRECGSPDPRGEMATYLLTLKRRYRRLLNRPHDQSFEQQLRDLPSHLQHVQKDAHGPFSASQTPDTARRRRRLYKGLGQLLPGIVTTIANVGTGVLSIHAGHPVDFAGLLNSSSVGVGMILSGKGDLDGE